MKAKEIISRMRNLFANKTRVGAALSGIGNVSSGVPSEESLCEPSGESMPLPVSNGEHKSWQPNFNIIRQFYRLGPEALTWIYNVDCSVIENHILNPDGIIGPSYYEAYPDVMEHLRDYSNDWLSHKAPADVLEHLKADLRCLAEEHKQYGAYTVLASLISEFSVFTKYMRIAAKHGIKEGMVSYGIQIARNGNVKEGGRWIERGADLGEEIGMLCAAISYQYGTLTCIDLDKAAHYYRRLINEYNNFYAYINLGTMYVEANYCHTAYALFADASSHFPTERAEDFNAARLAGNADTCEELLAMPFAERPRHAAMQYKQRELVNIFCYDRSVPPLVEEPSFQNSAPWQPDEDAQEIEPDDIDEHRAYSASTAAVSVKFSANRFEDFVFPTLRVRLNVGNIFKSQYELVFIERRVHSGLNAFIQQNHYTIRAELRKRGFYFIYLPAHSNALNEMNDILDYTDADAPEKYIDNFCLYNRGASRTESDYWPTLFGGNAMPSDCAGFLRYIPSRQPEEMDNYEFIFFPHAVDTDWERAFKSFFQYVERLQIITTRVEKLLPLDTYLNIGASGVITLRDGNHDVIAEVKMPVLSKALYLTFLNHPEGIAIKSLSDHREELLQWYSRISNRRNPGQYIDTLIDPTNNSANEKISRIRSGFESALKGYDDKLDPFVPIGKKGERYTVTLDRSRVEWDESLIHLIKPL